MRGLYVDELTIDRIGRYTALLADTVEASDPSTPVPTCGDWTLADLAAHLFEVQHFWCHVIADRPTGGPADYDRPEPPSSEGAAAVLRSTCARLISLLEAADAADPAWSWSDDHTVGFTIRRQIHEALVHAVDAVLAVGASVPKVPHRLAADGVDELVDLMLTGIPEWATFVPAIQVAQLCTTDTGDRWTMSLGHVSGTSTQTGVTYDGLPAADRVADDIVADLVVAGAPIDLLLWLWGRAPIDPLTLDGDAVVADALRATVVSATQ